MMKDEFVEEIDGALESMGFSDRAQLIRDAVYKELQSRGFVLPAEMKSAPSRAGKGGRPKKLQPVLAEESLAAPVAKKGRSPAKGSKDSK